MTSARLPSSFGLGKAIVSTPYSPCSHLADGRGILVPFADAAAIGKEIVGLLVDDGKRNAMRKAGLRRQQVDDVGWRCETLHGGVRTRRTRSYVTSARRGSGAPQRRNFSPPSRAPNTSCLCAMMLIFSSMRSTACRIGLTVTAWTITRAPCCCVRSSQSAKNSWVLH